MNAKNIAVKLYLTADAYLESKAKCEAAGVSMSTGGLLALRDWQPVHRNRRHTRSDMPSVAPKRPLICPGRIGNDMRRLH